MAKYLIGNIKGPKGDRGEAGPTYTAGTGIDITNNVISATNSGGITTETDPVFSASPAAGITAQDITDWNAKSDFSGSYNDLTNKPDLSVYATTTALGTGLARKQDTLTAGTNITIDSNNVISAAAAEDELPTIASGDAGKVLTVNNGETGVEWTTPSGGGGSYTAGNGIVIDNNQISRTNDTLIDGPIWWLFSSGQVSDLNFGTTPTRSKNWTTISNDLRLKGCAVIDGGNGGIFNTTPKQINDNCGTSARIYKWNRDLTNTMYPSTDDTTSLNAWNHHLYLLQTDSGSIHCAESSGTLTKLFAYNLQKLISVPVKSDIAASAIYLKDTNNVVYQITVDTSGSLIATAV